MKVKFPYLDVSIDALSKGITGSEPEQMRFQDFSAHKLFRAALQQFLKNKISWTTGFNRTMIFLKLIDWCKINDIYANDNNCLVTEVDSEIRTKSL